MSRLIDRIVQRGLKEGAGKSPPWFLEQIRRQVQSFSIANPVFSIENVAEYYANGTDKEDWDVRTDFPNLAPPFEYYWTEFKAPVLWRTPDKVSENHMAHSVSFGTLWHSMDLQASNDRLSRFGEEEIKAINWSLKKYNNVRWVVMGSRFTEGPGGIYPPIYVVVLSVDADGVGIGNDLLISGDPGYWATMRAENPDAIGVLISGFHPDYLAMSFMHCKNVAHRLNQPEKKLQKRRNREGKKPLVKFYTLEIEPFKRAASDAGISESVGARQALHICRGHFKDYRQSGLFGKVKGIFWWDSTVRGSSKQGVVVKDYAVKAPQ